MAHEIKPNHKGFQMSCHVFEIRHVSHCFKILINWSNIVFAEQRVRVEGWTKICVLTNSQICAF